MHLKKWRKGRYQWEEREHKEGVKEGEYDGCILYSCMKREKQNLLKLFLRGEQGKL
jgi:hypothetical protein